MIKEFAKYINPNKSVLVEVMIYSSIVLGSILGFASLLVYLGTLI
jgi:hypothetical protein